MSLFKVRVGVVVFDDQQRLLLARQNNRPFWVLPGGTLEQGETIGTCAVREIAEEANLQIALGPLLFVADFTAPSGQQVVDMVFASTLLGGTLEAETTQNINEIDFFSMAQAQEMPVQPEAVMQKLLDYWRHNQWPKHQVYLGAYA